MDTRFFMDPPKVLAITLGEPAGIGPDIMLRWAQLPPLRSIVPWVIGEAAILEARARLLRLPLHLLSPEENKLPWQPGQIRLYSEAFSGKIRPGIPTTESAAYVCRCLETAVKLCLKKEADALVTGPVHKETINQAGIPFSGHTEFLAEAIQRQRPTAPKPTPLMLLLADKLRVALVTTHLPLRAVADAINQASILEKLRILKNGLQRDFLIAMPRILVLGLNPHAGEGGHLGREEIEVIAPAIAQARAEGIIATAPVPADTAFQAKLLAHHDAVLAMYHDQGLPVLKYVGFGRAVNMTLGLPIIRTSVDHGTAFDLVGSDAVDMGSFQAAIHWAAVIAEQRTDLREP
jgi:4-hydroxythreonine-4-phosphate dehydrogenase